MITAQSSLPLQRENVNKKVPKTMPYDSMAQERFAHTPTGKKKFGEKNVEEFDQASKGMKLPERAPKPKKKGIGHRLNAMRYKTNG